MPSGLTNMATRRRAGIDLLLGRFDRVEAVAPGGDEIRVLPAPERVIVPLEYPGQCIYRPLIQAGDRVRRHQILGRSERGNCVHASVSGVVEDIRPVWTSRSFHVPAAVLRVEGDEAMGIDELYEQSGIPRQKASFVQRLRICGAVSPWTLPGLHYLEEDLEGLPPIRHVVVKGVNEEPTVDVAPRLLRQRTQDLREGLRWLKTLAPDAKLSLTVDRRMAAWARDELGAAARVFPLDTDYRSRIERCAVPRVVGKETPVAASYRRYGVAVVSTEHLLSMVDALEDRGPFVRKRLTVSGRPLGSPVTVEVPLGTTIGAVLSAVGVRAEQCARILVGGPMKGQAQFSTETPLTKSSHGLHLMGEEELPEPISLPCTNCGRCVQACPERLQVHLMARYVECGMPGEAERLHPEVCHECGLCGYVCPSRRPLPQLMRLLNRDRG